MKALQEIGWKKAARYLFSGVAMVILHMSFVPQLRALLLKMFGAHVGHDVVLHNISFSNAYHYGFGRIHIGNYVFMGTGVLLDCRGGITLEDHVTLSDRVIIVTHINVGYEHHPLRRAYPLKELSVHLERGVYVGAGAILLPGVRVGRSSVIGAGAVVTGDVPAKSVAVGVPAKVKKKIPL